MFMSLATSYNYGDSLGHLEREAIRYIQLHFEAVWRLLATGGDTENDSDNELLETKMEAEQLSKLLSADDLCADSEESVFYCLSQWMNR